MIGAFGDIALAIGAPFARYADTVLSVLYQVRLRNQLVSFVPRVESTLLWLQASQTQIVDREDIEQSDFVQELWERCLESYTGIIQSVKEPPAPLQPQQQQHDAPGAYFLSC